MPPPVVPVAPLYNKNKNSNFCFITKRIEKRAKLSFFMKKKETRKEAELPLFIETTNKERELRSRFYAVQRFYLSTLRFLT